MAENLLTIKYDVEHLKNKYYDAIKRENMYDAVLVYNRLRDFNIPEINLRQAALYSMLNAHSIEVDFLLKCVADDDFVGYNPQSVLMRISIFFYVYGMVDVFDYYKELISLKFGDKASLEAIGNPNKKNQEKKMHLVEDESRFIYADAINLMSEGKPYEAIEQLSKIGVGDPLYAKAQNFISVIYLTIGEVDKSKETLFNIIEREDVDTEVLSNVYRFSGLSKEDKEKLEASLNRLRTEDNDYEIAMVKTLLRFEEQDYAGALAELKTVEGLSCFGESYLKQLAVCYLKLGDLENLKEILKQLFTIYPRNVGARCLLDRLDAGETDLNADYLVGLYTTPRRKELKKYIKTLIKDQDFIEKGSKEQAEYVFNLAQVSGDYNLVKKISRMLFDAGMKDLVQDALLSVETANDNRQVIFQAIVECLSQDEWAFLLDGKVEKFRLFIPELFLKPESDDVEKYEYLLEVYAQTYSLIYYVGVDIWALVDEINVIFSKLFSQNLIEDYPLLRNAHYLIFLLVKHLLPDIDGLDQSFSDITFGEREQIDIYLQRLENL